MRIDYRLGEATADVTEAVIAAAAADVPGRLRAGDAGVFGRHADGAAPWIGWLRTPEEMPQHFADIEALVDECKSDGITHAIVLGMGGSSLCPEVTRCTFGSPSGIELRVLDSTDPANVAAVAAGTEPRHTLYIVASKSGTTVEPSSFFAHFWQEAVKLLGPDAAGRQFIAITDPGTALADDARAKGFRAIFENPADIGGRYAALSLFGLVPMALAGVPIKEMLARAAAAKAADDGALLGIALGTLGRKGRDKITLLVDPPLSSFGLWVEQLVAESLGKNGKGVVPVAQEPGGLADDYGDDRVFVYCRLTGELDLDCDALAGAGHPVFVIPVADTIDLGALYMTWELATAAAATLLDENPFDQPDVQAAKDATVRVLAQIEAGEQPPDDREEPAAINTALEQVRDGDYIAFLGFLPNSPAADRLAADIRRRARTLTGKATTFGYGPRFLHSTGQLHKGGPDNGVFIQLISDDPVDMPIPGTPHTFGTLKRAQAAGDAAALKDRGRRLVRIGLGPDAIAGLSAVLSEMSPSH